jgi:hypothetical protein
MYTVRGEKQTYPSFSSLYFLSQRGKFYPQLTNLVRINTPKAVQTESRKAFKKLPNLDAAVATLTNLKGVGTTLASGGHSPLSPSPPAACFFFLLFRSHKTLLPFELFSFFVPLLATCSVLSKLLS